MCRSPSGKGGAFLSDKQRLQNVQCRKKRRLQGDPITGVDGDFFRLKEDSLKKGEMKKVARRPSRAKKNEKERSWSSHRKWGETDCKTRGTSKFRLNPYIPMTSSGS